MKRSALVMGLVLLLAVVLAAGMIFAQGKGKSLSPTCSYTEQKDKNGQVEYVLTGDGCKAVADKINKQPVQEGKVSRCTCTLSTGSDIWICRRCTLAELKRMMEEER